MSESDEIKKLQREAAHSHSFGYTTALADVAAWHRSRANHYEHLNHLADWHNESAEVIERGDAKGASNE